MFWSIPRALSCTVRACTHAKPVVTHALLLTHTTAHRHSELRLDPHSKAHLCGGCLCGQFADVVDRADKSFELLLIGRSAQIVRG